MVKWGNSNVVINEEDLMSYFQFIQETGKIPRGKFHKKMKDLLLKMLEKEQFKRMYPDACEKLRVYYLFLENESSDRLESFLYFVNEEGSIPDKNNKITFVDGRSVFNYWKDNREKIYETLLDEADENNYKIKYPIAYAIIKDRFDRRQKLSKSIAPEQSLNQRKEKTTKLYGSERALEFIEFLEEYVSKYDKIPSTPYFNSNRDTIMNIFNDVHYQLTYPNAYKIVQSYAQYNNLTFEEKAMEVINYIDKLQKNIRQNDKVKFSNGDDMFSFWCTRRKEILQYFKLNLNSTDYPHFYRIVIYITAHKMMKNDYNVEKFFMYVDTCRMIGANKLNSKKTLLDYWCEYKEILNFIALNTDYDSKYPKACEIIRQQYAEEFQEERKRSFKL